MLKVRCVLCLKSDTSVADTYGESGLPRDSQKNSGHFCKRQLKSNFLDFSLISDFIFRIARRYDLCVTDMVLLQQ